MKKHLLLATRIFNTPLALSQTKFEVISSNVGIKLLVGDDIPSADIRPTDKERPDAGESTVVIPIYDTLVAKGGLGSSGYTSYESISKRVTGAIDAGASTLIFDIDSPGGEVSGLFSLVNYIASLPSTYGVSTVAFTDGKATSAAYAIATATQKIYTTESTILGSIGVIMGLVDQTQLDKAEGVKYHILRSKANKALGNPHEEITQDVLDKYKNILMGLDDIFNKSVVKNRQNLSVDDIIQMKGDEFLAAEAIELGLVDEIVPSIDHILRMDSKSIPQKINSTPQNQLTTYKGYDMTLEELKAQLAETNTKCAALETEVTALKAATTQVGVEATTAERTRCLDILASGETLKISAEQVIKRISAGTTKEDSIDIFTAIKEAIDASSSINSSITTTQSVIDNPRAEASVNIAGMSATVSDIMSNKGVK